MQCALMGIASVSDLPVFVSVDVDACGNIGGRESHDFESSMQLMAEYGASVVGFSTGVDLNDTVALLERAKQIVDRPLLVQLQVKRVDPKQQEPTEENPYFCPDVMIEAAGALRKAGAQFLRAAGNATPAYTGMLATAIDGFDTI